jgi:hypothetical protein
MGKTFTLALVVSLCVGALAGEAETVTYSMPPGGITVAEFLPVIAEKAGVAITYEPGHSDLLRKLAARRPVTLPPDEFFVWARSLLMTQRVVLVSVGPEGAKTWAAVGINSHTSQAGLAYVPADEVPSWADRGGALIATCFHFDHLSDVPRARRSIACLLTHDLGRASDIPLSRTLVVLDFAPMVATAKEILDRLDQDAAETEPAVLAARDPLVDRYEKLLVRCEQEEAAEMLVERIRSVWPGK